MKKEQSSLQVQQLDAQYNKGTIYLLAVNSINE